MREALAGQSLPLHRIQKPVEAVLAAAAAATKRRRRMNAAAEVHDEPCASSSAAMSAKWMASNWSPGGPPSPTISTSRACSIGKILPSPHAHARIKRIDTRKAKALPGVHAVLTYKDVPRVPHTTAGQAWPEPSPYDTYLLDSARCASWATAWRRWPPRAARSPSRRSG